PLAAPDPPLEDEESRLKEFAVLAFCAEMTRLPGHSAPRFTPENATAQTTPSRFTMVAHIWLLSPLFSAARAKANAVSRALWLGRPAQFGPSDPGPGGSCAFTGMAATKVITVNRA